MPAGSNMIFGMNGNRLMAGGELSTGGEAILPLNTLFNELNKNFDRQTQALLTRMNNNNNNQQTTLVLQLDGREVARGTFKNAGDLARVGQLDIDWF